MMVKEKFEGWGWSSVAECLVHGRLEFNLQSSKENNNNLANCGVSYL